MGLLNIEGLFSVEAMGNPFDREFPEDFEFRGESHNFTEIVYVNKGRVEVIENEKIYTLGSGDMILHAPMEFHRIKSDSGTSPRVFNLSVRFGGDIPEKLYGGVFALDINQRREFLRIFDVLNSFCSTNDSYLGMQASAGIISFITNIYLNNEISDITLSNPSAIAYRRVVSSINEELYSNLSLSQIAKINNMSVSYVKLLFRSFANTCPMRYYSALRSNEAAKLILGGATINEVSEMMNYSSPNYFSFSFRRHFGLSPIQYKKANV